MENPLSCREPLRHGPNKGQPATGTPRGYDRHLEAGEPTCPACRAAHVAFQIGAVNRKKRQQPPARSRGAWLPLHAHLKPKAVKCRCGAKGYANPMLVGRKRVVESCSECRV
jgi:hypothetical protein